MKPNNSTKVEKKDKLPYIEKLDKEYEDAKRMGENPYWVGFRLGLIKAKRLFVNE